ncbi:MAG TPA: type I restriction-modification enzyme R subunit C-terminal domain-containing protein [Candidatus Acidoferrales bacterium]|nr:type I restriction-modification enzyme R subunit C-terminal domain-containing protein [Candidatus Acidoferrales bacterium]
MTKHSPARPANSEWLTRKKLIDSMLKASGWKVVPFTHGTPLTALNNCAIEEYPTAAGPADYALCCDGKILGIVEAKKLTLGPQNVLSQAERYSKGLEQAGPRFGEFGAPFLYSTNGEVIWHHDVRHRLNRSRQITRFHTPDALRELLNRDIEHALTNLHALQNNNPRLRPYQREANDGIEKALSERKRTMLVAMATGTGKTFTLVNEIYRLMKSGVAKRILFLVDRRALAAQAVRAFASFEAEQGLKFDKVYEVYSQRFQKEDFGEEEKFDPKVLPASYLLTPKPGNAFVYVSTIQRMTINLFGREAVWGGEEEIEDDAEKLDIPIHAFDLVVADECHRGYTSSEVGIWRRTLDHFDAVKVGLTATPAAHTTSYFKDIVYRYEYERAVRENFLVDYDAIKVKSNVRLKGIFLKEGEEVGVVNPETGSKKMDVLEDEREFDSSSVERDITSPDSNRKILEEIKKYALEHEGRYGRFPKTLIFAVNDLPHTSHANQLVDLARDIFGRGDAFVQKITGSPTVDRPLQRIREFRNRPNPGIVVSVDMLTTGVDIPDLEYIVFLRPVKSRILFEQMLGRGTRKGEKFPDKSHFVVFDCFDGTLLEYFREATAITAEEPIPPTRTLHEIVEDIWANRDRDYNIRCLTKRLLRVDKEMHGDARKDFAAFLPEGDVATFAKNLYGTLKNNFTGTMALLRNVDFQRLLLEYKRKSRSFLVSHTTQDSVSSEWLIRGLDGKEYKPEDYLVAFSEYVKSHVSDVQAISVLLKHPQDWNPDVLKGLRDKLAATPQRFTVENLQRAHEVRNKKPLADIISMVKHAANQQSPLLNAAERVERAFKGIIASDSFTPEQLKWLERIRVHLQENLSIDQEDFESQPVFADFGGWGNASKVFRGRLPILIKEINGAIAA